MLYQLSYNSLWRLRDLPAIKTRKCTGGAFSLQVGVENAAGPLRRPEVLSAEIAQGMGIGTVPLKNG